MPGITKKSADIAARTVLEHREREASRPKAMTSDEVKRGIKAMGGPTRAAVTLGVSRSTIHRWLAKGIKL